MSATLLLLLLGSFVPLLGTAALELDKSDVELFSKKIQELERQHSLDEGTTGESLLKLAPHRLVERDEPSITGATGAPSTSTTAESTTAAPPTGEVVTGITGVFPTGTGEFSGTGSIPPSSTTGEESASTTGVLSSTGVTPPASTSTGQSVGTTSTGAGSGQQGSSSSSSSSSSGGSSSSSSSSSSGSSSSSSSNGGSSSSSTGTGSVEGTTGQGEELSVIIRIDANYSEAFCQSLPGAVANLLGIDTKYIHLGPCIEGSVVATLLFEPGSGFSTNALVSRFLNLVENDPALVAAALGGSVVALTSIPISTGAGTPPPGVTARAGTTVAFGTTVSPVSQPVPAPVNAQQGGSPGLSAGGIAGIVIACVVVVAILVVLVIVVVVRGRRNARKKKNLLSEQEEGGAKDGYGSSMPSASLAGDAPQSPAIALEKQADESDKAHEQQQQEYSVTPAATAVPGTVETPLEEAAPAPRSPAELSLQPTGTAAAPTEPENRSSYDNLPIVAADGVELALVAAPAETPTSPPEMRRPASVTASETSSTEVESSSTSTESESEEAAADEENLSRGGELHGKEEESDDSSEGSESHSHSSTHSRSRSRTGSSASRSRSRSRSSHSSRSRSDSESESASESVSQKDNA